MIRTLLGCLLLGGSLFAQPLLTHGQASGDPSTNSVSIWARASAPAQVSVVYATNSILLGGTESPASLATAGGDYCVRIDLFGLTAETTYWYRLRLVDPLNPSSQTLGPLGRFQTAPHAQTVVPANIGIVADINDTQHFDLFTDLGSQNPDLVLMLGDWPYSDASPAATTQATYRQKHKNGRSDLRLQNLLSSVAMAATWDDHEIQNDWDAATSPVRVALGRATWKEYMPIIPNGDEIYRSLRYGKGGEFFILDTRTHRDVNEAADLPGKTLLGATQLAWLKAGLQSSDAIFKFIVSSVPLRYGTTHKDHWQGFMRERREIFDWIAQQRIANVVVLSGDQHWSAIHHHREGLKEFQACPIATSIRTPPAEPEPEVIAIYPTQSFGMLRLDPTLAVPTATIEIHGTSGIVSTTTLEARLPGRLATAVDHPDGLIRIRGAHHFRSDGPETRFPYATAGSYELSFVPPRASLLPPDPQILTLPEGGFLASGAAFGEIENPAHPTLFRADFGTSDLSAWTVVDEGTTDAPSAWFQDGFELVQSSNIFGGSSAAGVPDKPGTSILAGDPSWTDYTFRCRLKNQDNDGVGVVFRSSAAGSYRFAMDAQRSFQRLTRTIGGVTTTLAENTNGFVVDHWYQIEIKAIGPQLSVSLDGQVVLTAVDALLPNGRIGLYCWGSQVVWFDEVVVRAGDVPPLASAALFLDDFTSGSLAGYTVVDQGTTSSPSAWTVSQGILNQSSNIYGGSLNGAIPDKPGSFLLTGNPTWGDTVTSVRLRNGDNDGIGLMFRVVNTSNYYRFSMDSERSYRRLTKTVNGVTTILVEDGGSYAPGVWYEVAVRAEGNQITVILDGVPILQAVDGSFTQGRIAPYVWGSDAASFDDLRVTTPAGAPASFAAHGDAQNFAIDLFASSWPSRPYILALAFQNSPGLPFSLFDPSDPRVLPLAQDLLFNYSLGPQPFFSDLAGLLDANGRATANATLPPGLSGLSFYLSGVLLDAPSLSGIGVVFPALPITLP